MSSSPPPPPPLLLPPPPTTTRKPTPIPWTHQETFHLIQAYQQKWYSLNRGQLKASQWDQVASSVPTKTSVQCRHKIEKLRKRYRAERAKPGQYNSAWPFFHLMDQMERGPMDGPRHVIAALPVAMVQSHIAHNHNNSSSSCYDIHNNNNSNCYDSDSGDDDDDEVVENEFGYTMMRNNNHNNKNKKKSRSINHIVNDYVNVDDGNVSRMAKDRVRPVVSGKRKGYFENVGPDEDVEEDDEDEDEDNGEGMRGGFELAAEIRGFAERFMMMENKKIEMMRETERYRMDVEKRRMEMILKTQRNLIETITSVVGSHKKTKVVPQDF